MAMNLIRDSYLLTSKIFFLLVVLTKQNSTRWWIYCHNQEFFCKLQVLQILCLFPIVMLEVTLRIMRWNLWGVRELLSLSTMINSSNFEALKMEEGYRFCKNQICNLLLWLLILIVSSVNFILIYCFGLQNNHWHIWGEYTCYLNQITMLKEK